MTPEEELTHLRTLVSQLEGQNRTLQEKCDTLQNANKCRLELFLEAKRQLGRLKAEKAAQDVLSIDKDNKLLQYRMLVEDYHAAFHFSHMDKPLHEVSEKLQGLIDRRRQIE